MQGVASQEGPDHIGLAQRQSRSMVARTEPRILRAGAGLGAAAGELGEDDEAVRCRDLLEQLAPPDAP